MDRSKLYEFDKTTVTSRLHRWGAWVMDSGVALGMPAMSAFMRMTPGSTVGAIQDEIDSECRQTNHAFNNVKVVFYRGALWVEYVIGVGKSRNDRISMCGCGKTKYYDYLDRGHIEIANNLNLMLRIPDKTDINVLTVSKVRLA